MNPFPSPVSFGFYLYFCTSEDLSFLLFEVASPRTARSSGSTCRARGCSPRRRRPRCPSRPPRRPPRPASPNHPHFNIRMWRSASMGAQVFAGVALATLLTLGAGRRDHKDPEGRQHDISLWIDERQVRMFSGISMQVFAIVNGHVSPYVLDPNFSHKLPIIPSEVGYVNFTWRSKKRYYYNFDTLTSSDLNVLKPPVLSIKTQGRVPKTAKEFSIFLPCMGNSSGVATFGIGLVLKNGRGMPLKGTPLRLNLKKECAQRGPDPECDKKCANQGWCNQEKICQCPDGYMGQHCRTALCYPQCMNGGNCTAPGVCSCPPGYQGRNCEGGKHNKNT
ncbi:hypothetical protein K1T71_001616 [Dendrolimus kikuchii]|uniref:Uncharacterized protein n=1 Tax=Dendrolimus kikuchii TaxID=765133 RepID=A0ACC1DF73_9NEOP|nr:hypothetical protein K1T71_001616 [Dendrolimus kikuchii]